MISWLSKGQGALVNNKLLIQLQFFLFSINIKTKFINVPLFVRNKGRLAKEKLFVSC